MSEYMDRLWRFGAATVAVNDIIEDLLARQGFKHLWEAMDRETRREVRATWRTIVQHALDAEKHHVG